MEDRIGEGQPRLEYAPSIGRRIRKGPWEDQVISTYQKIKEAVLNNNDQDIVQLAHYFVEEADVIFAIYRQWIPDITSFLQEKGVPIEQIKQKDAEILAKLKLPNGEQYDPFFLWHTFKTQVEEFIILALKRDQQAALNKLDEFTETWRLIQDRDVDHVYGLIEEVKRNLGESAIGEMWDRVLLPLFIWRYEKFDISKQPWSTALPVLLGVAIEAMRGHLCGLDRKGEMELIELEDRYILRFNPCGSGGRTVRGDTIEGTPPRMEPPYNWTVSEEPHSWNHFEKGICHYCTHCIRLMEEYPIDRFGYPLRVVDPPKYPDKDPSNPQKCQWTMFKDPTKVPEEFYARVGRKKEGKFGSAEIGAKPLPVIRAGMPGQG
jgi:hypothetical protein